MKWYQFWNWYCISLQPDSPFHGLEGTKHLGSTMVPAIYDASLADEQLEVGTEDAPKDAAALLPDDLAVAVGSGAGLLAQAAEERGRHIEAMLPDLQPEASTLAALALAAGETSASLRPLAPSERRHIRTV